MRKRTCIRCGKKSRTTEELCDECDAFLGLDDELKSTLRDKNRWAGYGFPLAMAFLALLILFVLFSWLGEQIPVI